MRAIKFRAWDGEQMVSPDYIDRDGIGWWKENSIPTNSGQTPLMQYTGLKDKKGQEIFECDVLRIPEHYEGDYHARESLGHVVFEDAEYCLCTSDGTPFSLWDAVMNWGGEVIGNIYEHSHLLEGGGA